MMIWEGKIDQTDYDQLSAADRLVVTLKNKNLLQTKNAQSFFLFVLLTLKKWN